MQQTYKIVITQRDVKYNFFQLQLQLFKGIDIKN